MPPSSPRYPVPAYLPDLAVPLLEWTRCHVRRVASRYPVSLEDLWDESMSALIRAAISFDATRGGFAPYAHTAIHRACWRYVVSRVVDSARDGRRRIPPLHFVSLESCPELVTASTPETMLLAREAIESGDSATKSTSVLTLRPAV